MAGREPRRTHMSIIAPIGKAAANFIDAPIRGADQVRPNVRLPTDRELFASASEKI